MLDKADVMPTIHYYGENMIIALHASSIPQEILSLEKIDNVGK